MKTRPFLALALLTILCCGADCDPAHESGPTRVDYGPTRNPYENEDSYRLSQQGQIGPCSYAWEAYNAAYFAWKSGQITSDQYREAERMYNECCYRAYPH